MNRRTGRPRNIPVRLALLERLPNETVGEIRRSGSLSRRQLSYYLSELSKEGVIVPHPLFSHLPEDGPGAKRYGLTGKGRHYRLLLRKTESLRTPRAETFGENTGASPARADRRPRWRRAFSPSVQSYLSPRYVGSHNWNFVMVIEASFRRTFWWESEHPMRNGGWISRHASFGRGISIQESGGTRFDPAGAAGHTISVRFSVKGEDPLDNDRRAWQIAGNVRAVLEREYECQLSEPVLRSMPKHSVVGDPAAAAVRAAGVALHGELGVDDTPEDGTLEFAGAEAAEQLSAYVKGVQVVGTMDEKLDGLAKRVDALAGQVNSLTGSTEKIAGAIERLIDRLTPPVQRSIPPFDPRDGGYG